MRESVFRVLVGRDCLDAPFQVVLKVFFLDIWLARVRLCNFDRDVLRDRCLAHIRHAWLDKAHGLLLVAILVVATQRDCFAILDSLRGASFIPAQQTVHADRLLLLSIDRVLVSVVCFVIEALRDLVLLHSDVVNGVDAPRLSIRQLRLTRFVRGCLSGRIRLRLRLFGDVAPAGARALRVSNVVVIAQIGLTKIHTGGALIVGYLRQFLLLYGEFLVLQVILRHLARIDGSLRELRLCAAVICGLQDGAEADLAGIFII